MEYLKTMPFYKKVYFSQNDLKVFGLITQIHIELKKPKLTLKLELIDLQLHFLCQEINFITYITIIIQSNNLPRYLKFLNL